MPVLRTTANRFRRWLFGRDFAVWYDRRYRLPLPSIEARTGFDARRADVVAWFLVESGAEIGRAHV